MVWAHWNAYAPAKWTPSWLHVCLLTKQTMQSEFNPGIQPAPKSRGRIVNRTQIGPTFPAIGRSYRLLLSSCCFIFSFHRRRIADSRLHLSQTRSERPAHPLSCEPKQQRQRVPGTIPRSAIFGSATTPLFHLCSSIKLTTAQSSGTDRTASQSSSRTCAHPRIRYGPAQRPAQYQSDFEESVILTSLERYLPSFHLADGKPDKRQRIPTGPIARRRKGRSRRETIVFRLAENPFTILATSTSLALVFRFRRLRFLCICSSKHHVDFKFSRSLKDGYATR